MSTQVKSALSNWSSRPSLPPPDSTGGVAFVLGFGLALAYFVLLLANYDAMTRLALWSVPITLLASLVASFALATMLGHDLATFQRLELDLARTVLAYVGGKDPPPASDSPLAGVWRAFVGAAEESRRVARAHAYALGMFLLAGVISVGATLLVGLGNVLTTQNVTGVGLFVNWFAFFFLVCGASAAALTVGYASPVPGFDRLAARRWRRNAGRQPALDGALSEVSWLGEYARGVREARANPSGRSVVAAWRPT